MKATYTTPGGEVYNLFSDALSQPHLLIAGASGSGKSVIINGLISTILYRLPADIPGGAQMILVDPKRVELAAYKDMPHTLAHAGGFNPDAWVDALQMAVDIMDARYAVMESNRLKMYNGGDLFVIVDEWAAVATGDLRGKPCQRAVQRLSCEGRAARVHLIVATQTPKAEVLPTRIKCNFDWRFCLRTNNKNESRLIMEVAGCETLPRYGQGFYCTPGSRILYNIPFVRQDELDRLTTWWLEQRPGQSRKNRRWSLFGRKNKIA